MLISKFFLSFICLLGIFSLSILEVKAAESSEADEVKSDETKSDSPPQQDEPKSEFVDILETSFDRMFNQLDDRFKDEFRRAIEQMDKDRKHIEELLGEEIMGKFYEHLEEMTGDLGFKLSPELEYQWKEEDEKRVLVIFVDSSEIEDFKIDINGPKVSLSGIKKIKSRDDQRQSKQEFEQEIAIPSDCDYTRPEFEHSQEALKISFLKRNS